MCEKNDKDSSGVNSNQDDDATNVRDKDKKENDITDKRSNPDLNEILRGKLFIP